MTHQRHNSDTAVSRNDFDALDPSQPSTDLLKLAFDKIFSTIALIALAPIMIIVSLLIVWRRNGTILFGHYRIGQNGRKFKCYKFRTMLPNTAEKFQDILDIDPIARDEWREHRKMFRDPRVSPLGAILRKTSLDELPQFWNVLRGDMSMVGPRPVTSEEVEQYGEHAPAYLKVRPGLTGAWQVSGRSDTSFAERVRLDAEYVRTQSFRRDLKIVLQTFKVVLGRQGAY